MSSPPLVIDVALGPSPSAGADADVLVLVDVVDESTRLVEALEDEVEGDAPSMLDEGRYPNLVALSRGTGLAAHPLVVVAALVNARPAAARIAPLAAARMHAAARGGRDEGDRPHAARPHRPVVLQLACAGGRGGPRVDDVYVAGVIVRLLLDELDVPARLTDAAGIAIAVGGSYEHPLAALQAANDAGALVGRRPEPPDVLQRCAQVDVCGVVPWLLAGPDGGFHATQLSGAALELAAQWESPA